MQAMYIRLRFPELEALVEAAHEERRRPADQAAILIAAGLRRRRTEQAMKRRTTSTHDHVRPQAGGFPAGVTAAPASDTRRWDTSHQ